MPTGPRFVFWMVVVNVLAAFWAAVIIEEKKPELGDGADPFSGVGESGASVILDSLLGPMLPEPDLRRRPEIIPDDCAATGLDFVGVGVASAAACAFSGDGVWVFR